MYRLLALTILFFIGSTSSAISLANLPLEKLALSQKGSIVLRNTSIGGLKIGMSENEVIKKLGTPSSRKIAPNGCTGTNDITLKYANLELYLLEGTNKTDKSYLSAITTTNSRYVTNKGIRVGDLMRKAEKAYTTSAVTGEQGLYLSLADRQQNECAIIFSSSNGKTISEIDLVCAVC
jgi:hypothetical protein